MACDALVVGGGPAGSTCARALARSGIDVVVMDKRTFPRDKVCAGWITPAVVESLELDVDDYRRGRVFQPITGFRTGILDGREVDTDYTQPVSFGIRRLEFDDYLLRRSGARLELGQALRTIERDGKGFVVNGRIRAHVLVGAGGHFCPVARYLGADLGTGESIIAAQELEFALTPDQFERCAAVGERPELYFCPDLKGYGWCFRKGQYLNIGLGREDTHRLSEQLVAFWGFLKRRGTIGFDPPSRSNGHAYLLYGHAPRDVVGDGVLLIGDAAGLAYAQSGEGIRPAIESGLMAAETILGGSGDCRAERLAAYRERLSARFGPRESRSLSEHVPAALKRALGRALMASAWFTRHVVLDHWFLHRNIAPLSPSGDRLSESPRIASAA